MLAARSAGQTGNWAGAGQPAAGQLAAGQASARQSGFALIAVLWVAAILSTMALSMATASRLKGMEAMHAQKSVENAYLLDSALDVARFEYEKYKANGGLLADKDKLEALSGGTLELMYPRYEPYTVTVSGQEVTIRIVREAGKFNVNSLSEDNWKLVLEACGVEVGADQTVIIESVQDWMDADSDHHLDGAEDDYYQDLPQPYLCKNAQLDNIEELLLIRGITPELYHGTDDHPGLRDFLSVLGARGALDINSAAPQAFALVEGLPQEVVDDLVDYRAQDPILDMQDVNSIVPFEFSSQFKRFFQVSSTGVVTLEASARGRTVSKAILGGSN